LTELAARVILRFGQDRAFRASVDARFELSQKGRTAMQRFFDGTLLLVSTIAVVTACGGGGKNDNGGSGGGTSTGSGGSSTNSNGGSSTTAGNPGNGGMTASNGGGSSTSGGATTNSGGASTSSGGTSTTSGGATSDGAGGSSAGAPAKGGGTSTGGTASGGSGGGATTSEAVLERNNGPTREGHFKQAALTKAAAGKMSSDTEFKSTLVAKGETSSDMRGSPLYMSNGPGGKAAYFAATTNNDVFAIDAATGAELWVKNIGSSPTGNAPSGAKGCGDIHPLGIISTPVIDAAKRTIYTVGAIGTNSISTFELHAIGIDDGMEKAGYPIDLSTIPSDKMVNVYNHNQRGALTLVNGIVYVPFGGHVGDCGTYKGRVIAVDTNDPTKRGAWAARGAGEAIWAPGGLASDGNGVLAITGNFVPFGNHAASRDATDSEEVLRLTGLAQFTRNNQNSYYATDWQNMDDVDADFGTMNPLVLNVPGSTPSALIAAIAKDGRIHLLDAANLGGADGHTPLQNFKVANASNSMAIHTVPATYKTATGTYIVLSTDTGAMCPTGQPSGKVVMGVAVTPGAPPTLKVSWCAALTGTVTAPIATTTDGTNDALVWYISNNKLTAVDGDTGAVVYTSADSCSGVQKWTSPIAANGHIVVGAKDKLCSWSPH
jgi:hypothetical protein